MKSDNILVVTNWGYEEGLIQSYTLPYLKIIHKVNPRAKIYLITQEKTGLQNNKEKLKEIQEDLSNHNIVLLPENYFRVGISKYIYTLTTFLKHLSLIFSKGIQYIHTFCTPAGSYGYLLSKASGKKLIVDSYEPHAEYMVECGVWKENGFPFKILNALEKKQATRATHLIATTPTMIDHTKKRFGIDIKHSYVKPACVDLQHFKYNAEQAKAVRKELGVENKIVCVYAGKFGDFYLKEEIFEFYKVCFSYWKEKFHVLLLSDLTSDELDNFCDQFSLNRNAFTLFKAPHHLVPFYMSAADFGLSPYRPTPSKKFCTPIKNGEYWAVGLPIVITRDISIDSDFIEQQNIGYVLKTLTNEEYRNAAVKIDELLSGDRNALRDKITSIAEQRRSYAIAENIYDTIYK